MIHANELRIGNWIRDKEVGYKDDFQVRAADIVTIALGKIDYHQIPLTPEILLAVGFRKTYNHNHAWSIKLTDEFDHTLDIWLDENVCTCEIELNSFDNTETIKIPNITSLHSLQNLWFFLTGTELEYKP